MNPSNIYGICVVNIDKPYLILAIYTNNCKLDLPLIKSVVNDNNMAMSLGYHYSFIHETFAWHMITDNKYIYILIVSENYPVRVTNKCLMDIKLHFNDISKYKDNYKENELTKACNTLFSKLCVKYGDLTKIDKISEVNAKINEVKLTMSENIEIALQYLIKLDTLEKKTEELTQFAGSFSHSARKLKNKQWWKNMKIKLMISGCILLFIIVIISIIAVYASK